MSRPVRQLHRWLVVAFTLSEIVDIAAQVHGVAAVRIGLLAPAPLILLTASRLWLFALPHLRARRGA
ncbi:hypothetical protein GE300_22370 [Rhodobacteraceae bacterium 2CG4]|uniref:Uncharacterized protein n=1 Tax=Halovulum marinum TaxID=2662447 RepID=A0A6L5Z7B8_9RHOB|nr:hypothetical protein [Halovulum marinum]MSU92279.1 hypothetical protein [Halovulum marinum]